MSRNNLVSSRLFVGSLPYRFTEGELLSLFIPFGKVISVRIIHTRWGKSRGMGYVEFDNIESATEAKRQLHNSLVVDRTIIVDFAEPDPMNTPEGQQRHHDAQEKRQKKFKVKNTSHNQVKKFEPESKEFPKRRFTPKGGKKVRQSVFDSRNFGSRVGAKFSAKSRSKRKK